MTKLILGIDPDITKIPNHYLDREAVDIYSWGKDIIESSLSYITGVKFQSAYFELLGISGLSDLSKLIVFAKERGLITIMDAKRGDIGSTSAAYARAYLQGDGKKNEFVCDFLTINPLMGEDCMDPFIEIALKNKKGVFILLETSNPGANMILKEELTSGERVNQKIATYISKINQRLNLSQDALGPIGCVIGATNANVKKWRDTLPNCLFLMPGIGAQGGSISSIKAGLTKNNNGVWVPISRGITHVKDQSITHADYCQFIKNKAESFFNKLQISS